LKIHQRRNPRGIQRNSPMMVVVEGKTSFALVDISDGR
jgi:hypothetical protein